MFFFFVVSVQSSPSPSQTAAASPSELSLGVPLDESHRSYHLTVLPIVGIAVTTIAFTLLVVLIFVIHKKSKELEESEGNVKTSLGSNPCPPRPVLKIQEGILFVIHKTKLFSPFSVVNSFVYALCL